MSVYTRRYLHEFLDAVRRLEDVQDEPEFCSHQQTHTDFSSSPKIVHTQILNIRLTMYRRETTCVSSTHDRQWTCLMRDTTRQAYRFSLFSQVYVEASSSRWLCADSDPSRYVDSSTWQPPSPLPFLVPSERLKAPYAIPTFQLFLLFFLQLRQHSTILLLGITMNQKAITRKRQTRPQDCRR